MVYDWDIHQETCYQLYIEEGRSLEDIMEHMRTVHKFAPSKRAFQTQFRRWNFPSKHRPAYKNDRLVSRIKELWERNLAQREMLRVLNEEDGFDIKPRELIRVRTRNRWLLRLPNGDKPRVVDPDDEVESLEDGSSALLDEDPTMSLHHDPEVSLQPLQQSLSVPSPEHQHDVADFGAFPENPEKKKRKRNRATIDASGLVARFPSEMTIDEARLILGLDLATYRSLRSTFQQICHEEGVTKKTIAGPDKWEASKIRLIHEITELQDLMWPSKDHPEPKKLALDAICTDVTKRMRTLETRMTLTEAKNALGINPQESREIRIALHKVLCNARFTCKSDATPQQWEDLKRGWAERSELIRDILDGGDDELDSHQKARALEVLARDVMKRLRDDRARKDPKKNQQLHARSTEALAHGSEDGRIDQLSQSHSSPLPVTDQMDLGDAMTPSNFDDMSEVSPASHMTFSPASSAMASHLSISLQSQESSLSDSRDAMSQPPQGLGPSIPPDMQLDPQMGSSLLLAASADTSFLDQAYGSQQYGTAGSSTPVFHQCPPVPAAVYAVYLRLHPSSSFMATPTLWIATINSHSLQELRQVAEEKFPGTLCMRVEGLVKDRNGGELPLPIEQDQQLAAYLGHLQGAAPTFNVQLVWKP